MNTSDRSISMVDAALIRRFTFIRMWPNYNIVNSEIYGLNLGDWLKALNNKLIEHLGDEAYDLLIGHSHLMENGKPIDDDDTLRDILEGEIIPLLEEYLKGNMENVRKIIGEDLLSENGKLIPKDNEELFHLMAYSLGISRISDSNQDNDTSTEEENDEKDV